ncbi:MAG: hypothetical protein RL223_523 [Pseudomonadota bacterium]
MRSPGHAGPALGAVVVWMIAAQVALHAQMAGVRLLLPLQVLDDGGGALGAGLLQGLFAVLPVLLALPAGRLADRHGYHRPQRAAIACALLGSACAWAATVWAEARAPLQALAALASGAGANIGLIALMRSAGRLSDDPARRLRLFGWVGVAPALANVLGPVGIGQLIDHAGWAWAAASTLVLPVLAALAVTRVPSEPRPAPPARPTAGDPAGGRFALLRRPGMPALLAVNALLSATWDVHTFAVPLLGHARGLSAGTIGLVLGCFTATVTLVRPVAPLLADHVRPLTVLRTAMVAAGGVCLVYPWSQGALSMAACAMALGLALGAVQPMVMATLHQLTPAARHGEAIALRSMTINASAAVLPLIFGLAGAGFGVGMLFSIMGLAVGAGSQIVPRLVRVLAARS